MVSGDHPRGSTAADQAGYSGTPLAKKLGIAAGHTVVLLDEPEQLRALLAPLPPGVKLRTSLRSHPDVVVAFFTSLTRLERRLPALGRAVFPAAGLWIAWPKKASGWATDIRENTIRELALPTGLVDNKVCAVDKTWSGLSLVWRKHLRTGPAPS